MVQYRRAELSPALADLRTQGREAVSLRLLFTMTRELVGGITAGGYDDTASARHASGVFRALAAALTH